MGVLDELEQSLNIPPLQFNNTDIGFNMLETYQNDVEDELGESADVETPISSQKQGIDLPMSKQQFYETYKQYLDFPQRGDHKSMYEQEHRMKGEQITNYLNTLLQRGGM